MNDVELDNELGSKNEQSGFGKSAFICGIIACSLNLLLFTAFFGFILGIISVIFGTMAYQNSKYGKAGLILGLLSFLILIVYALSFITIKVVDPFF